MIVAEAFFWVSRGLTFSQKTSAPHVSGNELSGEGYERERSQPGPFSRPPESFRFWSRSPTSEVFRKNEQWSVTFCAVSTLKNVYLWGRGGRSQQPWNMPRKPAREAEVKQSQATWRPSCFPERRVDRCESGILSQNTNTDGCTSHQTPWSLWPEMSSSRFISRRSSSVNRWSEPETSRDNKKLQNEPQSV